MTMNKNLFKLHFLIIVLLLLIGILFYLFIQNPILCEGDGEKFTQATQVVKETISNPYVSGNNNVNVQDPSLHIHNPNVYVPGSWGTDVTRAVGYGSAGLTVAAGINGMSRRLGSMPPAARAAWLGASGALGGVLYIGTNFGNTYVQDTYQRTVNNNNGSNNNGPFSSGNGANSMIEEGDSVDKIMNFLYLNLFLGICILLLLILLINLYINKKNIVKIFITWVSLIITSWIFIYLAYNLIENIDTIAQIYQTNTNISRINYNTIDPSVNQVYRAMKFLYCIIGLRCLILFLLYLLLGQYISTKIVNEKWDLSFIKRIFGEYFYYYFMKIKTYGSKTNETWMLFGWILLVIASVGSIYFVYFLINYIDTITELYQYTKNSTNYTDNIKPNDDINTLEEMVVYFGYKLYILVKSIFNNK